MKSLLLFAAAMVLASGGSVLVAQDAPEGQSAVVSPADAKKAAAMEKRKAQMIKAVEKKVATVEKKLKLTEEQAPKVKSILIQYYAKRIPLANAFRRTVDPENKKTARREIRQWAVKQEKALADILDEKQMKRLKDINESDMDALNPPPPGGAGGFGGGDGGGGGD